MSNLFNQLAELTRIDEAPVGDIMRKQKSIYNLWPEFDDRVDAVSAAGGIRLIEEGEDTWRFEIASATHPGHKYHAILNFSDIGKEIYDKAKDKTLWNKDGTHVDYNKLAKAIIDDVDVKVDHPDCPAYLYWGQKYINTQRATAYRDPENRAPKVRNPKEYGALCKHLQLLFEQLPFYTGTFAKMLKRYHSQHVQEVEAEANKTSGGVAKAADFLGSQQANKLGTTTLPKQVTPGQFTKNQAARLQPQPGDVQLTAADNDVKSGAQDAAAKVVDLAKPGVKPATGEKSEDDLEKEEKDRMAGEGGIAERKRSSEHFIERCQFCETKISGCRCMSEHKTIKYGICQECREIFEQQEGMKYVELDSLLPCPYNRTLDKEKVEAIKKKVEETGTIKPFVVTEVSTDDGEKLMIVDGHHRYEALKSLGWAHKVPVVMADHRGIDTANQMKQEEIKIGGK
jgi:hypothetical protein